tara:strand:- start:48 stop:710 length:663 start_codon:yes stop_codon:yes gene_type:complete
MKRTFGVEMKLTILTDNPNSWIIPFVERFKIFLQENHQVSHVFDKNLITPGDILFMLSCEKLVPQKILNLNSNNIVVHPSALPKNRGWSPLTWQILKNKNTIPVSLFEAEEDVDSGPIYLQENIELDGSELINEIKKKQGETTLKLLKKYISNRNSLTPLPQEGDPSFCSKITPEHSEINISLSIKDQFNRLRVADNERYPAFFHHKGTKYVLKIYKEKK